MEGSPSLHEGPLLHGSTALQTSGFIGPVEIGRPAMDLTGVSQSTLYTLNPEIPYEPQAQSHVDLTKTGVAKTTIPAPSPPQSGIVNTDSYSGAMTRNMNQKRQ